MGYQILVLKFKKYCAKNFIVKNISVQNISVKKSKNIVLKIKKYCVKHFSVKKCVLKILVLKIITQFICVCDIEKNGISSCTTLLRGINLSNLGNAVWIKWMGTNR